MARPFLSNRSQVRVRAGQARPHTNQFLIDYQSMAEPTSENLDDAAPARKVTAAMQTTAMSGDEQRVLDERGTTVGLATGLQPGAGELVRGKHLGGLPVLVLTNPLLGDFLSRGVSTTGEGFRIGLLAYFSGSR